MPIKKLSPQERARRINWLLFRIKGAISIFCADNQSLLTDMGVDRGAISDAIKALYDVKHEIEGRI